MNETLVVKTASFSSWHAAIAYVFVCTIVNASAPWIVKIAANSTPVTSKGYEWGPGLGVWLEDLKVGEGLVEIGFKIMEWR